MDRINEVRTVPRAKSLQHLRLPERLLRLKDEQQSGAMVALQQVDESLRQAVLDEWDARCRNRHPQPGRLSVRHHPEGHPRRVQGLGRRRRPAIDAACAAATASRTGTVCTATARAERPWPRGSAAYLAKLRSTRFGAAIPREAGTRSLPGIGFGSVMRRTVAAWRGPIPWG
jgi:hypothetical protein